MQVGLCYTQVFVGEWCLPKPYARNADGFHSARPTRLLEPDVRSALIRTYEIPFDLTPKLGIRSAITGNKAPRAPPRRGAN